MRNGPTPNIPIGEPRALVASDLERLREPRFVATLPQKLRESHHMIARFAALGLDNTEVGTRTGLIELTDTVISSASELSDAIADAYFQHASRSRTGSVVSPESCERSAQMD